MLDRDGIKALVAQQLAMVRDTARRDALRALLLAEPRREERDWNYGKADERFPYWVVAESPVDGILLVYCEQGFGPGFPWGVLPTDAPGEARVEDTTLGMDGQWNWYLEEAFVRSGLWPGRLGPDEPLHLPPSRRFGHVATSMNTEGLILLIPHKDDVERDAVAAAWERRGGAVVRLDRFWEPPSLDPSAVRVYGSDAFCLVLQQKFDLDLLAPADDLILAVADWGTRRAVAGQTLASALTLAYPFFAKPQTPKLFRARVYASPEELLAECQGLAGDTAILVSEIVEFSAEARSFVLDGGVLDCAIYEGDGDQNAAAEFVRAIVPSIPGPRAYVLDVGLVSGRGWGVVEFNAAWGAGLNGCDADRVLPAIAAASGPAAARG